MYPEVHRLVPISFFLHEFKHLFGRFVGSNRLPMFLLLEPTIHIGLQSTSIKLDAATNPPL